MKWEYDAYTGDNLAYLPVTGGLVEQLNHLGALGWELVAIKHEKPREDWQEFQCVYIFKRQVIQ